MRNNNKAKDEIPLIREPSEKKESPQNSVYSWGHLYWLFWEWDGVTYKVEER